MIVVFQKDGETAIIEAESKEVARQWFVENDDVSWRNATIIAWLEQEVRGEVFYH